MTDAHAQSHPHKDPRYLLIAAVLIGLTIMSFFMSEQFQSPVTTVLVVMCVAAIKTILVATFFMHMKFEGKWLYALTIPAVILAVVMICALLPDVAFPFRG